MTHLLPRKNQRREFQGGFSLIELMIAITLGLMIMAGLSAIFVKNSQARSEIERSNRQLESGRYAMALLSEDLRMAGFLAAFDPYELIIKPNSPPLGAGTAPDPVTPAMAAMPDPCATSAADLNNSFFFHVQGIDNAATIPTCVSDVRAGSDILVVRRVSSCVAGPALEAGCDAPPAGVPFFQSSNCYQATELARQTGSHLDYREHFRLNTDTGALDRRNLNCTVTADYRRFLTHIYFVANNNVGSDGIPTLKRAELGAGAFSIVPLVEGIETVQFEYGIDKDGDGRIDDFTADPNLYNGCAGGAACIGNWLRTYAVRINLLARNVEPSKGWADNKTYTLGLKADGTSNVFPASGTPSGDPYKRHAYNATVRLDNPQGRRTP